MIPLNSRRKTALKTAEVFIPEPKSKQNKKNFQSLTIMGLRHQIAVFAFICFGLLGCAQPAAEIAQSTETATEPNPTATAVPSDTPTVAPTATETLEPTQASTATLTNTPTPSPTESPTITPIPDLNTALGAHYTFSGNAEDSTGNENHGAVTGATLIEDRFGRPDEAYLFDGIDDFIEVAHSGTIGLQFDSTVSAWVFVEEQVEDTWYSVIEKTDPERHGHSRWGIWLIGDQAEFCVQTYSVPFHYCLDSLEPVGPEKWHHIVGVWTGDTIKLYIDGELSIEKTHSKDVISNTGHPLFFGTDPHNTKVLYTKMQLDDVRIYQRKLSAEEVEELYVLESAP